MKAGNQAVIPSVSQGKVCTVWAPFASSEEERSGKRQNRRLSCKKNKIIISEQYLEESFAVSAPVPPTSMEIFLLLRHPSLSDVSLSQNVLHFPPCSPAWTHGTKPSLLCPHENYIPIVWHACPELEIRHPQFPQFFLPLCIFYLSAHSCLPPWFPPCTSLGKLGNSAWGPLPSPVVSQVWPPCFTSLGGSRSSSQPWVVGDEGLCLMSDISQTFPVATGTQELISLQDFALSLLNSVLFLFSDILFHYQHPLVFKPRPPLPLQSHSRTNPTVWEVSTPYPRSFLLDQIQDQLPQNLVFKCLEMFFGGKKMTPPGISDWQTDLVELFSGSHRFLGCWRKRQAPNLVTHGILVWVTSKIVKN